MKKILLILCLVLFLALFSCNKAEEQVKVLFFTNGGNEIPAQKLEVGAVATEPEPPIKENGIFDGWYYGDEEWDFSNAVTKDIILIAKWNPAGTLVFDLGQYANIVWDTNYDTTRIIKFGDEVGTLPEPSLAGYNFIGWYKDINDITSRIQSTSLMPQQEEFVLYPLFEGDYTSHNWSVIYTEATCTEPAKKIRVCEWHNERVVDEAYSRVNPALGHKWEEGSFYNYYGWQHTTLAVQRECDRDDCGYKEQKDLENITSKATIKIGCAPGTYPREDYWPNYLTDGKWSEADGALACSPKGGGDLMITLQFDAPQEVDQIALSVCGNPSPYKVYLLFEGKLGYEVEPYATGMFYSTNATKETAAIIDLSELDSPVVGIRIVRENTLHAVELFYELTIGKIPE